MFPTDYDDEDPQELNQTTAWSIWWEHHGRRLNSGLPTPSGRNHIGGNGLGRRA